jgi:hypothetical protein
MTSGGPETKGITKATIVSMATIVEYSMSLLQQ